MRIEVWGLRWVVTTCATPAKSYEKDRESVVTPPLTVMATSSWFPAPIGTLQVADDSDIQTDASHAEYLVAGRGFSVEGFG